MQLGAVYESLFLEVKLPRFLLWLIGDFVCEGNDTAFGVLGEVKGMLHVSWLAEPWLSAGRGACGYSIYSSGEVGRHFGHSRLVVERTFTHLSCNFGVVSVVPAEACRTVGRVEGRLEVGRAVAGNFRVLCVLDVVAFGWMLVGMHEGSDWL